MNGKGIGKAINLFNKPCAALAWLVRNIHHNVYGEKMASGDSFVAASVK